MKTISLNGTWNLKGRRQNTEEEMLSLTGTVPGCVQLDLSKHGYLPNDIFMGENIKETEKFENYEWWYERTFTAPEERENVFLVFEGVDCIAEYFLNGEKIGESENMFIAHEFEIGKYLKEGENHLCVHFSSVVLAAHEKEYTLHTLMSFSNGGIETQYRIPPHAYGWDIMPRAINTGLWREVRLEARDTLSFSQLFFKATPEHCAILYELSGAYDELQNVELVLTGKCGNDSFFEKRIDIERKKAGNVEFTIQNPKLWWPYGYGEPNIYDVTAQILQDGKVVHEKKTHFGIRNVVLEKTDLTDGKTGCFRFLVNGVEIMCKGSNWVPLDAFHCRDKERLDNALSLVRDIGCNILRCWGGNVYEDEPFFDFCDRNGIMVWQDFSMACRIYPETDRFKKLLEEEAVAVIKKLRHHPSLILWSGDNEIDANLKRSVPPSVNRLTREVLPNAVVLHDIERPYLASSPYISDAAYYNTNPHLEYPENHLWGPRDYYKSDFYKNSKAHFVSETGYHGCPSLSSIKKFITPDRVWPYQNNPEWILHSSDQHGDDSRVMLMEKQIKQLFGKVPTDPETYILASQISQAEAKKYFIERIRIGRPDKTGIIWWNLLDGWPQMSDAVVDYYFEKKLAYGYIKRSQAPFTIVSGEINSWEIKLYACNDTLTSKEGTYLVKDADTDEILLKGDFSVDKNCTAVIGKLPVYYSQQKMLIIQWETDGKKGMNHYLCGFPSFSLEQYKLWMEKYNL